jgi:hypothetical protein
VNNQIARQLGSLPVQIVFDASGMIGFVRMANMPTIVEWLEDGLQIVCSNEDICVGTTELAYNVFHDYKNMPEVLYWLKSQELEL